MGKKRVVILGGGMAGLATAWYLSHTAQLREDFDVSVYQQGWRLGGKAASARDADGRNLEHGLHIWFGFYECAFGLLQEVYAARQPAPNDAFKAWTDAFKPQTQSGIGVNIDGVWSHVPLDWPITPGFPGDGEPFNTLWGSLLLLLGWLGEALDHSAAAGNVGSITPAHHFDPALFARAARAGLHPEDALVDAIHGLAGAAQWTVSEAVTAARHWGAALGGSSPRFGAEHLVGVAALIEAADQAHRDAGGLASRDPAARLIAEALHIFAVTFKGAMSDLVLPNCPFETIDDEDFSAWLLRHGADPGIVATSSIVRIMYDFSFQYTDGDPTKPDCAAGSGLGAVIRMLATYKGAMMNHVQGGFGEAVVAPLYQVLKAHGVRFNLFHKVIRLEAGGSEGELVVQKVRIDRQAYVVEGDYEPTFPFLTPAGLMVTSWPREPKWDRLVDGDRMRAAGVNFESHWCSWPAVGREALTQGEDFDILVLAVGMGAYKPLGDDPGMCKTLIDASPAFRDFVSIPITPTLSAQIWCNRTLDELGWTHGKSATVAGPEPLDIWAEMGQVLDTEPWLDCARPVTLHYLCGSFPTRLYAEPSADPTVPARAADQVKALAIEWLNRSSYALWPSVDAGGMFDWRVLTDRNNGVGEARFDAQFWRANVDPTECCVACATGTTTLRLFPDGSGFGNLIVAGEGTRHGLNAAAVEAAVMSGMAAARAISGQALNIPGYDFLRQPPV